MREKNYVRKIQESRTSAAAHSHSLDRIYVSSNLCDNLRAAQTHVCSFTDHKALTLRLGPGNAGTMAHGSNGGFRLQNRKSNDLQ